MELASAWWKSTTAGHRNTFSASLLEGCRGDRSCGGFISSIATLWGGQRPALQEKSKKRICFAAQNA
jgi:hypothetical protein